MNGEVEERGEGEEGRRGKEIYFHCTCEWNEMKGEEEEGTERKEKEGDGKREEKERKEGEGNLLPLHL